MFDLVKKILGEKSKKYIANKGAVPDADIALSVLLLEAAHADGECSTAEKEHMSATLVKNFNIPKEEIDELLKKSYEERQESVDLFHFTRFMNNNFTRDEKIAVMESVWRIILIDDHLEAYEDHFAHKLANLLRLTHKDLIDAKLQARQQLR